MNDELVESRLTHLETSVKNLTETMGRIERLLTRFEGAGTLVKAIFFIVTPILGLLAWAKDHIKS